jgi:uncharacterized SAM-binding protein YcdF (DUF218 family)
VILAPLRIGLKVLGILVGAVLVYLAVTLVQVWLTSRRDEPRPAAAIVVMGAAQYNGVPSPDLRARLDEALALYRSRLAPVVVVTGGKEAGDQFTEAQAAERFLAARGVPAADILEAGGSDSYENLSEAAQLLEPRRARSVLIATDPFHEDRSLAIASSVGLTGSPTPTQTSPISGFAAVPHFLREAVAVGLGRVIGYRQMSALIG